MAFTNSLPFSPGNTLGNSTWREKFSGEASWKDWWYTDSTCKGFNELRYQVTLNKNVVSGPAAG